ncbi:hypothetical protein DESC_760043 [Desulfosarcina cetonica]|nr:hypothetical protein DESC_760043 [Desulfosarcina cetonica]
MGWESAPRAQYRPGITPAGGSGGCPVFVDDRFQAVRLDGFGDVITHPRRETAFTVTLHGMGRHGDDRNLRIEHAGLAGADLPGGFVAVHFRHLDVHQYQIIWPGSQPFQGNFTIAGRVGGKSEALQQGQRQLLVDQIVFDQKNAHSLLPFPNRQSRHLCYRHVCPIA